MPIDQCCVEGCKSKKPGVKLFNIPANAALRDVWMQFLLPRSPLLQASLPKKEVLIQKKVCILHFEEKYITGNKRRKLACPTLFSEEEILKRKPSTPVEISFENLPKDHNYSFGQSQNTPGPSIHQLSQNEISMEDITLSLKHINNDHTYAPSSKIIVTLKPDENESPTKADVQNETQIKYITQESKTYHTSTSKIAKKNVNKYPKKRQELMELRDNVEMAEFIVDNEDLGEADMDQAMYDAATDAERPKEAGPFSWQMFTEDVFSLDEKQCTDDVKFVSEAQLVPDLCDPEEIQTQAEFSCNVCNKPITEWRYACAQCRDWDVCGACAARGEHPAHYVLRVPQRRAHKETQTVLAALRQLLEGLPLHEDPSVAVIKDEVKSEDPLGDDEAPLELSEVLTDVADTGQASEQKQPPDTGDPAASEDALNEAEYLDIDIEEYIASIASVPTDTVTANRPKRKLYCKSNRHTIPQKVQRHDDKSFGFHYNNDNKEMIPLEKSSKPELAEDFTAPRRGSVDSVPPLIEELCVNKNAVASAANILIQKLDNTIPLDHIILIECPNESSVSVENMLDRHMQPKDLRVNITRLAEDEIRAATRPREGKR